MKNSDDEIMNNQQERLEMYAFPGHQMALIGNTEMEVATQGLTKLELLSAMAMQGMLSNPEIINNKRFVIIDRNDNLFLDNNEFSEAVVTLAGSLLSQLDKKQIL